jgi:hypothetical protein
MSPPWKSTYIGIAVARAIFSRVFDGGHGLAVLDSRNIAAQQPRAFFEFLC